ncbi:MAG TPA: hypothetical protein VHX38_00195 [Pseudonocardiaceae bacterium]|nr:hypothetical protein [Pseudonocardiaceae bacterium]
MTEQPEQPTEQPEQAGRAFQAERPRPIADLLVDALEHLPAADRKRVTAWVLARTTRQYNWLSREGAPGAPTPSERAGRPPLAPPVRRVIAERSFGDPTAREALAAALLVGTPLKGEHQVVPVRLPAQLHTQLRDWCAEHGFSMATVIRGLLTRFLEGQPNPASGPVDDADVTDVTGTDDGHDGDEALEHGDIGVGGA